MHYDFGKVTLRDQNDRLHQRLDHLQNKFGTLASTKTDLSSQLLFTEEEKLKVSHQWRILRHEDLYGMININNISDSI